MTNIELQQEIELLQREIKTLQNENNLLKASGTFPYDIGVAIEDRLNISRFESLLLLPTGLQSAPLSAVSSPTGGATQDAEARTAINSIISRLQSLGLIS